MSNGLIESVMKVPLAYRLWQAPFAAAKFAPVEASNDLSQVGSVLDIGCGPGTNAARFAHADYLGIDYESAYIERARARHPGRFICADAVEFTRETEQRFEIVLINSLLHHLDDDQTKELFAAGARVLAPGGQIHVLELVLPDRPSVARALARLDRGDFARSPGRWRELFVASFEQNLVHSYNVGVGGLALWRMIYLRGRPRIETPASQ